LFRKEFILEQGHKKVTRMIRGGRRGDSERDWIVQPRKMKMECRIL